MKKTLTKEKVNVFYLKVSDYYRSYLLSKYGNVVCFPTTTRAYDLICRSIVNNGSMSPLTPFAFSEAAFVYKRDNAVFDISISLPPEEERMNFIEIGMPSIVYRFGKPVETGNTWQISRPGAVELRKLIVREFWQDMLEFVDDCFTRARIQGNKITRENAMSDFMSIHGINMKHYETMLRYERRFRNRRVEEIESNRSFIESRLDSQFTYT